VDTQTGTAATPVIKAATTSEPAATQPVQPATATSSGEKIKMFFISTLR